MMKLVLIRHGESEWNKKNLFTGWADVDLSEAGRAEAAEGGRALKEAGYDFDVCYTSYLKRAIHTLNIVLDEMDRAWLPVIKSWRLNERHYGALQGLNKAETKDKYGNDFTDNPEIVTADNIGFFKFTLKDGVTRISSVNVQPGDRKYKDLNGDGVINADDRKIISNSNPKFSMGLGNNFSFWNFDLSVFLEGVFGREILNEFKCRSESNGTSAYSNNLQVKSYTNRWTPENGSTTYSRLMNQTGTYVSSYYVEDASFVRIKNISLGYNVPAKLLDKAKISTLKFTLSVDNAFVFTKYTGMDPDVSSSNSLFSGFDRMSYPKARVYSFGINLTF